MRIALALACCSASFQALHATPPAEWLAAELPALVELYKELHAAPELSHVEENTAAKLAKVLESAGCQVTAGVGGTGVVAVLKNGAGKTLLLRADMDALPVAEETGLAYASKVRAADERGSTVGVMHACGHDIHMTNLMGVAKFMATHRDEWQGTVVFICQPAEERGAGAEKMLADGLFKRFPRPDFAIALHVAADYPCGKVGYCSGYSQANVDSVDIVVQGRGGHGAYPETTIDPIVIAAKLVLDLQTIVSRELKPIEPAVITVGSIHGGAKHNVISDDCTLQLTVRSYSQAVRDQIAAAIRRKADAAAQSAGAPPPEVKISEGTPSLYNDPELTERVAAAMRKELGDANVAATEPSMGGEDFSQYGLAGVPICMFKVGGVPQLRLDEYQKLGGVAPSLHSAKFYPDPEQTLTTSLRAMSAVALELLKK
jgi:amidohydrolase